MTKRTYNALRREKTQKGMAELLEILDKHGFSRTDWLIVLKIASSKPKE